MSVLARQHSPELDAELVAAERFCAGMARREAKNFYWGFVALPRPKRMAIYALYDFARQVDDEADRPAAERSLRRLDEHRRRLERCLRGDYDDDVMRVLGPAVERYAIPPNELFGLIDGVEMDLRRDRYATWEELSRYCAGVASTVGRMCVRIFGFREERALDHAHQLGLAMQLTNILRDVREDWLAFGRIYLPADELDRHGLGEAGLIRLLGAAPGTSSPLDGPWAEFVAAQVERARGLFADGLPVVDLIPLTSAACVLTMAGIYQGILRRIERDPYAPLARRITLSPGAKLAVAVRSWLHAA
jgi:phytoene synthase